MSARSLDTFLFDLDGTLIDSVELIRISFEHTLRTELGRDVAPDEWLAGLGTPLVAQFANYVDDAQRVQELVAAYRAFNAQHHDRMVTAYAGIAEMLGNLRARGVRLAVVTSKANAGARRGLVHCGLSEFFDVIVGCDDVARHKPAPEPVLAALERLGSSAERAIYIGDSPHDIAAGRAAKCRTGAVLWGPFPRAWLEREAPGAWFERPAQIAELA